ncbi:MAG: DHH family phosphoesterase [Lachnospiraceae bacterium]|nr:DHH family phosphoesterase [Lachnospiraceae bacterium]
MSIELEKELTGVHSLGIAGHVRPDGDSIGACVGLWAYVRENFPQVETVDMWLEKPDPKCLMVEGCSEIRQPDGQERSYDLFIAVDCAARDRLGGALPFFAAAKRTLCIDHHVSNPGYADENEIDGDASSTCELLCRLMNMEKISARAAAALYMGIAHDTGVFQYSCTSPATMRVAADLMEKGIPASDIVTETFFKKTYSQNQILGKALLESMRIMDGRCVVSEVNLKEMKFFGVEPLDLEGIVSQLKLTEGVEVAIFLHETANLEYKVSLRSGEKVDVSKIAAYFGGGGHARAAGVTMKGTFHDIINNLTLHIERQLTEQEETC